MSRVVLGVDPGFRNTGFGVIRGEGERLFPLAHGRIAFGSRAPLEKCLCHIYDGLSELIRRHQPQALALEEIFLARNVKSALTLGEVRGVILLAAARAALPVFHYPALVVKKALVGYGQATKEQVQLMVEQLLGLKVKDQHAADALAVGVCHLFHSRHPGFSP